MNFGGLETGEYGSKLKPGLVRSELGNPLDEQRHDADFDMGFDATRQPMIDRLELQLSGLECAETTLDDHQALVS